MFNEWKSPDGPTSRKAPNPVIHSQLHYHCFYSGPPSASMNLPCTLFLTGDFQVSLLPKIPFFSKSKCDYGTHPFWQGKVQTRTLVLQLSFIFPDPHGSHPVCAYCQPRGRPLAFTLWAFFHCFFAQSHDVFLFFSLANSIIVQNWTCSVQIYHHDEKASLIFLDTCMHFPLALTMLHWGSLIYIHRTKLLPLWKQDIHPSIRLSIHNFFFSMVFNPLITFLELISSRT